MTQTQLKPNMAALPGLEPAWLVPVTSRPAVAVFGVSPARSTWSVGVSNGFQHYQGHAATGRANDYQDNFIAGPIVSCSGKGRSASPPA